MIAAACGGGGNNVTGPSGIAGSFTVNDPCAIEDHGGLWRGTLGLNSVAWVAQQGMCSRDMTGVFELVPGPNVRRGTMAATFVETKVLRFTATFAAGTFPLLPSCTVSFTGTSTDVSQSSMSATLTYSATEECVGFVTTATSGSTTLSLNRG